MPVPLDWLEGPSRSPDGEKVAYGRFSPGAELSIYVVQADGWSEKRVPVTGMPFAGSWITDPSWSPDGTAFVVFIVHGTQQDIFCVDVATGEAVNLTNGVGLNLEPAWRRLG